MCISNIGNRRPYPAAAAVAGKINGVDTSLLSRVSVKEDFREQIDLSAFEPKPLPMPSPPAKQQNAHIVVQHNYHDHSNDSRANYQEEHPARGGVTTPFPLKLHEMLENVARDDKESIVSWQPHGRCFVVHKPKEFVELLPNYFKLSKLASFQRQLNLYGFQRLTRGRDRGGYYHELFLRGKVFLSHNIQRIKVKGTGVRARSNPDQEPDFWAMNWVTEECQEQPTVPSAPTLFSDELSIINNVVEKPIPPMSLSFDQSFSMSPSLTLPEDQDVVFAFGNKTFHYLDPFNKTPLEQEPLQLQHQQQQQTNLYNQGTDDLLSSEAESFFEGFDFPDNIGSEIEDDNIFGDMLEQIIS